MPFEDGLVKTLSAKRAREAGSEGVAYSGVPVCTRRDPRSVIFPAPPPGARVSPQRAGASAGRPG